MPDGQEVTATSGASPTSIAPAMPGDSSTITSLALAQLQPQALTVASATLVDAEGLTGKDFTDLRNDAMREGVKALVLMNGGGSVALLAFLQAIWAKEPALVKYILWGIFLLVIGVGLAGLVHLFRVHTSNATQRFILLSDSAERDKAIRYQRLYFACAYASLAFFVVGVGIILVGASR